MTTPTPIAWGHNPGQRYVKDTLTQRGQRRDLRPYPAVIAPWQAADELGLARHARPLTAQLGDARYLGGALAERLPLANRQMAAGRLDPASPLYPALAQMSAQHAGLLHGPRPSVLIATALPVAWRDPAAEAALAQHLRDGLRDLVDIAEIVVQSEPNAIVSSQLLDDDGQLRPDQSDLARDLVCVGDIGGGTLNLSVLDRLAVLPGQSASPLLGSGQAVRALMQQSGMTYLDAERRLEQAVARPQADPLADALLRQYRETIVAAFQQAWAAFHPRIYLFAGGTLHWVADDLRRAFPRAHLVEHPQQAIAIGLWRYARRKALRGRR